RECILQSTSEVVARLEHPLSWRPSGNLIASSQQLPHRHDVVFFERNGLRHGEFTIREEGARVVELLWNSDSTVLAVWLERVTAGGKKSSAVQLWTTNNYYWYFKQEIRSPVESDLIAGVAWDPELALRLVVVTADGLYQRLDFCMDVFISATIAEGNPATVAVVDGRDLLLTPFKFQNVPPPMSALRLPLPSPAAHVAFGPTSAGDDMAVLLCDSTRPVRMPETLGSLSLNDPTSPTRYRQLLFLDETTLATIHPALEGTGDDLAIFTLANPSSSTQSDRSIVDQTRLPLPGRIVRIHPASNAIIVQMLDGCVKRVEKGYRGWDARDVLRFPAMCPWMGVVSVGKPDLKEEVYVGLTDRNKLYVNDRLLSPDCTSFALHDDFLALSTLTHTARFVPLDVPLEGGPRDGYFGRGGWEEASHVSTLRDPFILLTIGSEDAPRKLRDRLPPRIRFIHRAPRTQSILSPLSSSANPSTKSHDYRTSYLLVRKHRLDMNLLVDHDPAAFSAHVTDFVAQVDDPEYLNLFLSGLRNEDVIVSMYGGAVADKADTAAAVG
ncbi:IKI3 family-domain-containing protein, partial [Blyttiomyces helicus]